MDPFKLAREIRCREAAEIGTHFPMARAAICLTCEELFRITETCPACASEHVMALATWLYTTREGDRP